MYAYPIAMQYSFIALSLFFCLIIACQEPLMPSKSTLVEKSDRLLIGYYNQATVRQRKRANIDDLDQKIDTSRFKQLSILSPSDALLLEHIIQDSTITMDNSFHQAHCYDPHHSIMWTDKNQYIIAYLEICFTCHNARGSFSPNIYSTKQFDHLQAFFRERKN